jgi:Protein involved in formate dehydrogenase formation
LELQAIRAQHPELTGAVEMHLELLELHRRIQGRVPLPMLDLSAEMLQRHQVQARPVLRFEDIPLDLTDLRLMVRQTAEVLRRFGALEQPDFEKAQNLGRDMRLLEVVGRWFRGAAERQLAVAALAPSITGGTDLTDDSALGQVIAVAMRPFLSRCAEVLQQRPELSSWSHSHCALCGGEPDLAVITPSAERHLICGRCSLRWKFEPVLPQQRPRANHFVCDHRREVSRLRLRRLPSLSQGVRRPTSDTTSDADGRQRCHTTARRGSDAARLHLVAALPFALNSCWV